MHSDNDLGTITWPLPRPAAKNMTTSSVSKLCSFFAGHATSRNYYGKKLGSFTTIFYEVAGDIYAVDSKTLHIRKFHYNGGGPGESMTKSQGEGYSGSGNPREDEKGASRQEVTREKTQRLSADSDEAVYEYLVPSFRHELKKCSIWDGTRSSGP